MLKEVLKLEGVQELTKKQQKSLNGGQKCEQKHEPMSVFEQESGQQLCMRRCRPSFLGIGLGEWSEWEHNVLC